MKNKASERNITYVIMTIIMILLFSCDSKPIKILSNQNMEWTTTEIAVTCLVVFGAVILIISMLLRVFDEFLEDKKNGR